MTRRALLVSLPLAACAQSDSILSLPPVPADARIPYGSDPFQFGDLRLPKSKGPHPLAVMIHGGYWKAAYNLDHISHLCAALAHSGMATWSLEYRRIGNPGGGWPGTLDDVLAGARHLEKIAKRYNLDLGRVTAAGHSAGGQLALWLAAQPGVKLNKVVSLAGVSDLRRGWELRLSSGIIETFLGGTPQEVPGRYRKTSPIEMLPIATPQFLLHGTKDDVVPFEISERFAKASKNAKLIPLPGSGHFELIDPRTKEWKQVREAIQTT